MTVRDKKIAQMLLLASECGYVCEPTTKYRHEFILSLASHLVHRRALAVFQSAAYSLTMFPRQAAIDMLGRKHLTMETKECYTWQISTIQELSEVFGTMLNEAGKYLAGLTRAITTESEPTASALAMLIPPFEVSSYTTRAGSDRLHISLMYVVWDDGGGMHPPKDNDRREMLYNSAVVSEFRHQALVNARQLAAQGVPLSSGWCSLLGLAPDVVLQPAPRQKRKRGSSWEVDCILEERRTSGKAKAWLLVRWKGYDPDWECFRIHGKVGSSIETWEPLTNLRNCVELASFRALKSASGAGATESSAQAFHASSSSST